MRTIIALILFCCIVRSEAAIYYVRADGSATQVNAIGPTTDSTKCMSMATCNASTFSSGDTVYFSDKGGNYTAKLAIPSGGTPQNVITYAGASGERPKFTVSASGSMISVIKSNIVIQNISITNALSGSYAIGFSSASNVFISDITITNSATYGIGLPGWAADVTLSNVVVGGSGNYDLYAFTAGVSNLSLINSTIYGKGNGVRILGVTNITLSGVVLTNAPLEVLNCGGLLSISDTSSTNSSAAGAWIHADAWQSGIITNSRFNNSGLSGLLIQSDRNITIANCTNYANVQNGFKFTACTNFVVNDCLAVSNSANFSGYLSESNSSGIVFNRSVATDGGSGFKNQYVCSNLVFNSCTSLRNPQGFADLTGTYGTTYNSCISEGNNSSGCGFNVADVSLPTPHDITFNLCTARHHGSKSTEGDSTGFAVHYNAWNIAFNYCSSRDNSGGGFAIGNTSSGYMNHCTASNNAANWTSQGGIDMNRAGFYFFQTGYNTTNGGAWTMTNCVGIRNYPRELYNPNAFTNRLDNNYYCPISNQFFYSDDGGVSTKTWWQYHGTNEPHSVLFTIPMIIRSAGRLISQ